MQRQLDLEREKVMEEVRDLQEEAKELEEVEVVMPVQQYKKELQGWVVEEKDLQQERVDTNPMMDDSDEVQLGGQDDEFDEDALQIDEEEG